MMRYAKYGFRILLLAVFIVCLDYNLPSIDVVKVVGTEVVRTDVSNRSLFWSSNSGSTDDSGNRDIRFINSAFPDDRPRVYRNEDTGWGWPPYFKFDSGDLQADAELNLRDQGSGQQWVAVRHYGWRSTVLSIYPNALSLWPVAGSEENPISLVRIAGFIVAALFAVMVWRLWTMFKDWTYERFDWVRRKIRR